MHISSKFKEVNLDKLHDFIQEYPLATLITSVENTLDANHIPFYLQKRKNGKATLQSHIAKANSLWKKVADGQDILLIFHGPNAYISPNFYPSKKETGKIVPTWNYSVVHVRGRVFFKHEGEWILKLLNNISDFHELNQSIPWSVSDAPEEFINNLTNAVVGLEVIIDDMIGNFKLSQNKAEADYFGVVKCLANSQINSNISVSNQMKNQYTANKKI